jgi:hypothetical protein
MCRIPALVTALLTLIIATVGGAIAAPPTPSVAPPLRLRYLELPPVARGAVLNALPVHPKRLIVQFAGPIQLTDRAALVATGVEVLEYLPDYAYLVTGTPQQLAAAAALPGLAHALAAPAVLQLDPALLHAIAAGDGAGPLRLLAWPGREARLIAELNAAGIQPGAPLSVAAVRSLATLDSLRWAEPDSQPRLLNDGARTTMGVDAAAWQGAGLYGEGQILAIADSGLDTGELATLSPDFAGRLVAAYVLAAGGDLEDEHGHGTHVAGSALGSGTQSGSDPATNSYAGSFAGVAPRAGLVFQAFEADAGGTISGLPADYYQLFDQAYQSGARLHSDSWGDLTGPASDPAAMFGGYPYGSQRADSFVWDHPDMAIFVAAGNSGRDGTPGSFGFCNGGNGVVDADSLLSPATAKNVITVGASESSRTSGGLAGIPWLLLNFCFATQPIANDPISGNADGLAAFSSRGPTDDGRIKPDLVAPGTNIISSRSHAPNAGVLWGAHETNPHYVYSGGTSMATPLVAGAGALVREWLTDRGATSPSAALIKATLLNTARDIAPGQYGIGATQELSFSSPNSVAGWGRADLGFLAAPASFGIWYDDHVSGLSTGQQVTYTHTAQRPLEVTSSAAPLRVHLVWTDPAASLSASQQLVNDLDLSIVGPDGTVYRGNNSASGDRVNNVEGVEIKAPPLGLYVVQVRGFNVPIATQPYALVVSGPIAPASLPQTITFPAPSGLQYGDAPQTLTATASSGLPVTYSVLSGPASVNGASLRLSGAGEVRVRASQAGGAGYEPTQAEVTFTVAKAPLNVSADDQVRKIGQPNPPLTIRYSGFVNGDDPDDLDVAPSASTGAAESSPEGDYPIIVAGGSDANYALSYASGILRVTPRDVPTLSWADPEAITYGEALSAAQLNAAASFGGASLAGSYSYDPPLDARLPAGDYTLKVIFTPADTTYESVSGTVRFQVNPAPLAVSAADQSRVYGQPNPQLAFEAAGFVNGDDEGVLTGALATAADTSSPIGRYDITQGTLAAANYAISYTGAELSITPAPLEVSADDKRRTVGEANPTLTYRVVGLVNGDTPASALTGTLATTAEASSPAGSYPITRGTLAAANYTISFTGGVLAVTPAAPAKPNVLYLPLLGKD